MHMYVMVRMVILLTVVEFLYRVIPSHPDTESNKRCAMAILVTSFV